MDSGSNHSDAFDTLPVTLAFHKVSDSLSFGISNYSPSRIIHLLDELCGHPLELRKLLITFDDAYAHLGEILPPLLEKYPIEVLIFVPTAFIGKENVWDYSYWLTKQKHLSSGQIRTLSAAGVSFGTHGHTHRDLTRLNSQELIGELEHSKKLLESIVDDEIDCISYPFGRFDQKVMEAARAAGYRNAYTMRFPAAGDTDLTKGRYPIYSFDTPQMVLRKLSPGPGRRMLSVCARSIGFLSRGTDMMNRVLGHSE